MTGQNLIEESTENLIEYIRWKDDPSYTEIAEEAFKVFTYRFQYDLLVKLITICKNWGYDEQVATDIAYGTFDKIWKYPTYDQTKSKQKDFDKGVKFYLYRIAMNLLASYKRVTDGENPYTGDEDIVHELPDITNINCTKERKSELTAKYSIINEALGRLSPKHKIIYLTYKQYEVEGHKLPRELLRKLRTELDLTQSSVKVYKNEAFKEVDTYLNIYGSK